MMEKVFEEMREAKKVRRAKWFGENSFRKPQDQKRDLAQWDVFMDIPYAGEIPS